MTAGCTECFCIPCRCECHQESWTTKPDDFKPGSMGCHEAYHMSAFLENAIREALYEHPAIQMNKEWLFLAGEAMRALIRLYQLIGKEHLSA